ncbi:Protein RETICULATA-RELATED 1, chloroplastic [Linum perenne]
MAIPSSSAGGFLLSFVDNSSPLSQCIGVDARISYHQIPLTNHKIKLSASQWHCPSVTDSFSSFRRGINCLNSESAANSIKDSFPSEVSGLDDGGGGDVFGGNGGSPGGGDGFGGNGGSPGGGDDGDDGEEDEFGPIMKLDDVIRETEARGAKLPVDMLAAAETSGIREKFLLRYLELQDASWPLGFLMNNLSMLRNRMMADPDFLFKVGTEVVIDSCCATFAEVQKRGKDFWSEFELYAADLLVGVLYGSVGFGCGLIGQGIANMIMNAKRSVKKSEEDIPIPPLLKSAALWGVFLAVSSNTRYQIINGLEQVVEGSALARKVPPMSKAFTIGVRFANNIYGGMQFVDWAKWSGVQ